MAVGSYFSVPHAEASFWQISKVRLCKMLFLEMCHLGPVPEVFKRKRKKCAHFIWRILCFSLKGDWNGIGMGFEEMQKQPKGWS